MSDVANVGLNVTGLTTTRSDSPISQIICEIPNKDSVKLGDSVGSSITINCDFGEGINKQAILDAVAGWEYTPYEATGVDVNPAQELGDGVTFDDVGSGIYNMTLDFGAVLRGTFRADGSEESDHEYPFQPTKDRSETRQYNSLASGISAAQGAAEGAMAGLDSKIDKDGDLTTATAVMYAAAGKAVASVWTEAWSDGKNSHSLVTIESDLTKITNKLSVGDTTTLNANLNVKDALDVDGNCEVGGYLHLDGTFRYGDEQVDKTIVTSWKRKDNGKTPTILCV